MVSDITGVEADEDAFVTLIVRSHKAVDEAKSLDVLPAEIAGLKEASDLVTLEIRDNGNTRQVVTTLAEFRKLIADEVVVKAQGIRGRRIGYSPAKD
ncbi:hypothetical protein E3O62_02665 [Cryobacterium sp. TMT2-15-1]|uniref:hypothetical protein n=1 Tax=Cryobacterium sp. TMT2-15-1 TaxID=1259246 RepID=UPI0011033ED8|nr:hypothetical protein [Cryobacterium sp. TMT2-15-1]TFC63748.1 hypothetical protein E3O62_02665 [Cryobacterium sp. TMT2-15-1]